jgi:hypothetical protein
MASIPEPPTTVVRELVDSAARDLARWLDPGDPNRTAAARSALTAVSAAILALQTTRQRLLIDLYGEPDPMEVATGNSGPGLNLPTASDGAWDDYYRQGGW